MLVIKGYTLPSRKRKNVIGYYITQPFVIFLNYPRMASEKGMRLTMAISEARGPIFGGLTDLESDVGGEY